MNQVRIKGRDLRAGDYLAGGIGKGPDPAKRVRRVEATAHGQIVGCVKGYNGIGARQIVAPDTPMIVWREVGA